MDPQDPAAPWWRDLLHWAWLAVVSLVSLWAKRKVRLFDEERRRLHADRLEVDQRLRTLEMESVTSDTLNEMLDQRYNNVLDDIRELKAGQVTLQEGQTEILKILVGRAESRGHRR